MRHRKSRHRFTRRPAYSPRRLLLTVLGVMGLAQAAAAGEIYKSVDADGHVVYSDHLDPSLAHPTLVQLEDPRFPPHELHFCWTNCFTLILDNGVYRRVDGTDESWTIETFSAEAVVLHRHDAPADWNGSSRDVVYSGQVANDRLIGVTVAGKPVSGVDAAWGSALNTLPANNAERDAKPAGATDSPAASMSSSVAPPPVTEEDQPPLSEDGLIWTPGYWYLRGPAYFWMSGAWVRPPQAGLLWTPAYWSAVGAVFTFHPGHWASTVGYYGGINYGHGYPGSGYTGGRWASDRFIYNSSVNHLNSGIARQSYAETHANANGREMPGQAVRLGAANSNHPAYQPIAARDGTRPADTVVHQTVREPVPAPAVVSKRTIDAKPVEARSAPSRVVHATVSKPTPAK